MNDLFKQKAEGWDTQSIPQLLSKHIGPAIIEHIKLNPEMEVMDFGAGTGLLTSHIAPVVKSVAAVDISRSMLEKLLAKPELHNKVTAHCQNILYEPLGQQFDLIVSAMAMHHVQDTSSLLKGFAQHLKPGALIALADLDKEDGSFHPPGTEGVYHLGFVRKEFAKQLEASGFEDITFHTAYTVKKENVEFPIFLVIAKKH